MFLKIKESDGKWSFYDEVSAISFGKNTALVHTRNGLVRMEGVEFVYLLNAEGKAIDKIDLRDNNELGIDNLETFRKLQDNRVFELSFCWNNGRFKRVGKKVYKFVDDGWKASTLDVQDIMRATMTLPKLMGDACMQVNVTIDEESIGKYIDKQIIKSTK